MKTINACAKWIVWLLVAAGYCSGMSALGDLFHVTIDGIEYGCGTDTGEAWVDRGSDVEIANIQSFVSFAEKSFRVTEILDFAFAAFIFEDESHCLLQVDNTKLISVTIPPTITNICDWAFSCCVSLTSITIPDSVRCIGVYAFGDCTSLTNVTIGSRVNSIEWGAFDGCRSLINVYFKGPPPRCDCDSWSRVFDGIANGARGHYEPEYAEAWKEVIDPATGMWEGLVFDDSTPYTVSFDANGGEGEMEPVTVEGEGTVVLPANAFQRTNYRFEGWATNQNGEVVYEDEAEIPVERDMTLWAVWDYVEPPSIYGVKFGPYATWDFTGVAAKAASRATLSKKTLDNCIVLSIATPMQPLKPLIKIRMEDRAKGNYACIIEGKVYSIDAQPVRPIVENGVTYGLYGAEDAIVDLTGKDLLSTSTYGAKKLEIGLIWTVGSGNNSVSKSKYETFDYFVFFNPLEVVGGQQLWYPLWKDMLLGMSEFEYSEEMGSLLGKTLRDKGFDANRKVNTSEHGKKFQLNWSFYKTLYARADLSTDLNDALVGKDDAGKDITKFEQTSFKYFIDTVFNIVKHENKHAEVAQMTTHYQLDFPDENPQPKWIHLGTDDKDSDCDGLLDKIEDAFGTSKTDVNTFKIYSASYDEEDYADQELYVRHETFASGSDALKYHDQDWSYVGKHAPPELQEAFESSKVMANRVLAKKVIGKTTSSWSINSSPISQMLYDAETSATLLTYGAAPNVSFSGSSVTATGNTAEKGLSFNIPVMIGTVGNLTFRAYLLDEAGNALAVATTTGTFPAGAVTIPLCFSADTMAGVAQRSTGPYVLDRVGCQTTSHLQGESAWSHTPLMSGINCGNVVWQSDGSYVVGNGQCVKTSSGLAITLPVFLPAAGTYKFAARLVPDGGRQAISVAREEVNVSGLGIVNVTLNFPADDISHSKHTGAFRLHSLSVTSEDADVGDWLVPNFKTPSYSYTDFQSSGQSVFIDAETISDSILYDGEGMAVSLAVSFTARNSDMEQLARGRFKAVLESEDGREVARFNETFPMINASDTYVLAFSGADIRAMGVAGPYVLASLSIEDPDTGEILDALTSASWKTAAYGAGTFATGLSADAATFVLDEVKDAGTEQSGIRLSGMVEIPTAGIVDFEADLVNAAGMRVCSGYSQTDCPSGVSTISLVFPAPAIFQSGLDGPYYVTSATATYSGTPEAPVVIPLALETQPYACGDFAKWSNYEVALDRQNGSGGTANVTAIHGELMPGIKVPARSGYVFLGYYTEPNGKGIQYYTADGSSARNWDRVVDTTLYAHWTDRQTVTFEPNGGTCKKTSMTAIVGETYTTLATASWENHVFQGWYDDPEGGNRVRIGMEVTAAAERTLYAHWKRQTVHFDANGGTCKKKSVTCYVGGTYTTLASASWDGRKFLGWYDARTGGNRVKLGMDVTADAERTLYAHWGQTVRFDANGGTSKKTSLSAVVGETYPTLATATRAGHTFLGWYDAREGGTRVRIGMEVPPLPERTLYAHWKESVAALSISGFAMSPCSANAFVRDARSSGVECTLWYETVADVVYEVQWTPALGGEWTVLKRWFADEDGERSVTVDIPSESFSGFFRLVRPDAE